MNKYINYLHTAKDSSRLTRESLPRDPPGTLSPSCVAKCLIIIKKIYYMIYYKYIIIHVSVFKYILNLIL